MAEAKCILVTGATGFVGRALVDRLVSDGRSVRAAVRRAGAILPAGVMITPVGEIGPGTDWSEALVNVDTVVHLAARAHVPRDSEPESLFAFRSVNAEGTRRVAEAARSAGVRRIVYVSTVGVHGMRTNGRTIDEASPFAPATVYAQTKLEGEEGLLDALERSTTEWVILRPPLVYGPGAPGNFGRLMRLVARGVPLPLGSVRNRRSLIYVGNLADAIVCCIDHPAAAGRALVVSDCEDVSTADLVYRMARAAGIKSRLVPCPLPLLRLAGALLDRRGDISRLIDSFEVSSARIRTRLGWQQPISVDQGLLASMAALRRRDNVEE